MDPLNPKSGPLHLNPLNPSTKKKKNIFSPFAKSGPFGRLRGASYPSLGYELRATSYGPCLVISVVFYVIFKILATLLSVFELFI